MQCSRALCTIEEKRSQKSRYGFPTVPTESGSVPEEEGCTAEMRSLLSFNTTGVQKITIKTPYIKSFY